MAATSRQELKCRDTIITNKNIVIFVFDRGDPYSDKQTFLFHGYYNNSGMFVHICGFRQYEFSIGTYQYGKWYTSMYMHNILGNITTQMLLSNTQTQFQVRFNGVPQYSTITCASGGAWILSQIQEIQ